MRWTRAALVAAFALGATISCSKPGSSTAVDAARPPASDGGSQTAADGGAETRRPPAHDGGPEAGQPPGRDGGTDGPPPAVGDAGSDEKPPAADAGAVPPPDGGYPYPDAGAPPPVIRRIAVIGDYGGDTDEEGLVAKLIKGWNPDAVITAGDNNYGEGSLEGWDAAVGQYFHPFMGAYKGSYGPGATTNKFWPALGDHDWQDAGLESWLDYFTLPGNERYYDVDLGPVHLYALNSNSEEPDGYKPTSKQGLWLQEKLAASKSCFDLVYFHHPPYSSGHHGSRDHMDWPFGAWGADATFAGHDHHYERLDVAGIPYFVIGSSGLGLREFAPDPLPETKFRNDQKHGAILVTASSDGTITYEYWSIEGVKLDALTLKKAC